MVDYMHLLSFVEMPSTIFHMTCVMLDYILDKWLQQKRLFWIVPKRAQHFQNRTDFTTLRSSAALEIC